MARRKPPAYIDLTNEAAEAEVYQRLDQIDFDLAQDGRHYAQRSPAQDDGNTRSVAVCTVHGFKISLGECIEVNQRLGEWRSQFVEIKKILIVGSHEIVLWGIPYTRNKDLYGPLEAKLNEICQIVEVVHGDNRPDDEQAMISFRPRAGMIRRSLNKTNMGYRAVPNGRFGNDPTYRFLSKEEKKARSNVMAARAPLTCRWRLRVEYQDARRKQLTSAGTLRAFGGSFVHLSEGDVHDPEYRVADQERRKIWLGREPELERGLSRYTLGDIFCGFGGASSGGQQAGLEVRFAIDNCPAAAEVYRINHPRAVLREANADIVKTNPGAIPLKRIGPIDILHLSPPCQPHSPAHTRDGKNDDINRAVILGCGEWINLFRPRMATLEQTFGILHDNNIQYFHGLVQQFTSLGYSVQWRYRLPLIQYGLPQDRHRLILIACGPGEQLPEWPAPTHGPGKTPYVTEAQAIDDIPPEPIFHDVRTARRVNVAPRDPNLYFPRTITTGGAEGMAHYSGQRVHTLRELSNLQGCQPSYKFAARATPTTIRKQIGNAYPPCVAKVIFKGIRQHLRRLDCQRRLDRTAASPAMPSTPHGRNHVFSMLSQNPSLQAHRPSHNDLNGGLDDDAALEAAIKESGRVKARQVIVLDDSDEDELQGSMNRLNVEPSLSTHGRKSFASSAAPAQPSTGNSHPSSSSRSSATTTWSSRNMNWQSRSAQEAPSSAASSVTLDNSPRPSPSPSPSLRTAKRKRDTLKTDDRYKEKRQRVEVIVIDDDEMISEMTPRSSVTDRLKASGRIDVPRKTCSGLREEALLPRRNGDGRLSEFELKKMRMFYVLADRAATPAHKPRAYVAPTVTDENEND